MHFTASHALEYIKSLPFSWNCLYVTIWLLFGTPYTVPDSFKYAINFKYSYSWLDIYMMLLSVNGISYHLLFLIRTIFWIKYTKDRLDTLDACTAHGKGKLFLFILLFDNAKRIFKCVSAIYHFKFPYRLNGREIMVWHTI